jgi:hypothetical protein
MGIHFLWRRAPTFRSLRDRNAPSGVGYSNRRRSLASTRTTKMDSHPAPLRFAASSSTPTLHPKHRAPILHPGARAVSVSPSDRVES